MSATEQSVDPYLWLEDVESEQSLDFAKACNAACLDALGNPESSTTYERILAVLESDDRIPSASKFGVNEQGEPVLFNFWKDKTNPKGLWRKTTLASYRTEQPEWETVLDVDALAEADGISWVWKGSSPLPRSRDGDGPIVTRSLLSLSRGGSDAVHIKEFDLSTGSFVTDEPFILPEAKSRASYKSRDVLLVGSDFGPGSVTDSGYPRQVREWVRGTDIADAPIVFEGDKKDVSVGMYVADERVWYGGIYEVQCRSLTFYTSKYWIRKVEFEHLLAPTDPRRAAISEPPPFVALDIQEDATISFLGKMLIISLRSDWSVADAIYKQGSVIVTDMDTFLAKSDANDCEYTILFEPTERTAYEYFTATKNYLILSTMDNVKSKLSFYKIVEGGSKLEPVGRRREAQIRDCSVSPVDPYSGSDDFWFSTSDFVTPSTLFLADAAKIEDDSGGVDDPYITTKVKSLPPQYDSSNLSVEQRVAISKDGTEIPYFIIMKKGLLLDSNNPTLLYGYGGFEVSLGPHYIATAGLAWLERGGVYVEANIRGGGEFGPAWQVFCNTCSTTMSLVISISHLSACSSFCRHQAGLKASRNKCYEDFIAVGEHLISDNICTSKTLAARGGSNVSFGLSNLTRFFHFPSCFVSRLVLTA